MEAFVGRVAELALLESILSELSGDGAAELLDGASEPVDPQRFSRFVAVVDRLAGAVAAAPAVLVIITTRRPGPDTDLEREGVPVVVALGVAEPARAITIVRAGGRWRLSHRGREGILDDLVGVRYLARLVNRPGTEISALDLVTQGRLAEPANHAVLDEQARAAYARRARVLADDLVDARGAGDLARVDRLEVELDALTAEIERSTGINGRSRHFGGPAERARTAVRKAITRAINAIAATEPEAADLLRATVTTGYRCVYRPR